MNPNSNKTEEIENLKLEIAKLKSQITEPAPAVSEEKKAMEDKTIPTVVFEKWTVPSRIFIKRDNKWFVAIAFVILVFILLFAFLQDILPIFVLVALMFLVYLLGTVEPQNVTHEITNKGIFTTGKTYNWGDLKNFWFAKHNGWVKFYIETKLQFPARLIMLVRPGEEMKFFERMKDHLSYFEQEKQSWFSRIADGEYISLATFMPKEESVASKSMVREA